MRRDGFSLIEVLIASALLAVATGVIWGTWLNAQESSELLDKQMTGEDELLRAFTVLNRELRGASLGSVAVLPEGGVAYRVAEDLDGNGLAIDAQGALELGDVRRIVRDVEDVNGDGIFGRQLVVVAGARVEVLANYLQDDEDLNGNGALDALEDSNGNGRLDRGVWMERTGEGIEVRLQVTQRTRRGYAAPVSLTQFVRPRNP